MAVVISFFHMVHILDNFAKVKLSLCCEEIFATEVTQCSFFVQLKIKHKYCIPLLEFC